MNGKDGKPFKTREGGVMRLEYLICRYQRGDVPEDHGQSMRSTRRRQRETAKIVGLSAIKYGDLSNQASKDYVFDIDRFTSFEGNTGPYILYTIVRIKSILNKYQDRAATAWRDCPSDRQATTARKRCMLELARFNSVMENAFEEIAPHKICAYIYDLANAFNKFYHETKILGEEDEEKQSRAGSPCCS